MADSFLGAQFCSCLLHVVIVVHRTQVFQMRVTPEGDCQRNGPERDRLCTTCWEDVHSCLLSGACARGIPVLAEVMVLGVQDRRQQVNNARRGRYDSPQVFRGLSECCTQVRKRNPPDRPAPSLSEFVTFSVLACCCTCVLSNSVFVTAMLFLLGAW